MTAQSIVKVSSISLNKIKDTLIVGSKNTLTETVSPNNATSKAIVWATSNSRVATVSNGVVTAVGEGTAIIKVTSVDGSKTATCNVTVNNLVKVSSIGLNKTKDTLTVGTKDTLIPTVSPINATNKALIWTTSNSKVVTVKIES